MARVLVIDERDGWAEELIERLRESPLIESCQRAPGAEDGFGGELGGQLAGVLHDLRIDTVVYAPPLKGMFPDLIEAEAVFQQCADANIKSAVVLSSAAIYGASNHNPGLMSESRALPRSGGANCWADLEGLASIYLGGHTETNLTVFRPAMMPLRGGEDHFSRLFGALIALRLPGHDPTIQVLSSEDLARAVRCAIEKRAAGIYNVAPAACIPLGRALRITSSLRLPIPRTIQRALLSRPAQCLDFIRYAWTVSDEKIRRELGFAPRSSSADALAALAGKKRDSTPRDFDDFGMDADYIAAFGRRMFDFLEKIYWRIEVDGRENLPREGRAVLVGVHRGFMPWDAVMALHLIMKETGRIPRFLIHPTLIKFPFLFNFHTRLGGIIACQENADYVLSREEMLGIYPEGIHGAFTLYRNAYRLGKFGRDEYVKMALRNRAPIIPFVNVGSAEIYPILGRIEWKWWKRWTEWPFLPITPTWPLIPLPLPSKWHTQFLEPIHIEEDYPPEAAEDRETVRAISQRVRAALELGIACLLGRRRHIFFGSVFDHNVSEPLVSKPAR
jgi:1-acyl-sn-glycerol-3-phosphate acyltransferase/nucleoside-diphosphate-sugar epimerase